MSTLHAILLFVGVPLLIFVAITLLVMAPSLAKGPRYRPGQGWDAEPEWFGALPAGQSVDRSRQLEAGPPSRRQQAADPAQTRLGEGVDEGSGGASVRW